jgi:hypothetical protein
LAQFGFPLQGETGRDFPAKRVSVIEKLGSQLFMIPYL